MGPSVALLCVLGLVTASAQFVEEVDDVARPRRQLLQEEEGEPGEVQEEIVEEVTTTTTTTTEEPFDAADQAGPTRFYREYGNLPKFLMEVDNGMELTLYREGSVIDTYILDMKADGGITGSKLSNPMEDEMEPEEQKIRKEDFKLTLDYKSQSIVGPRGHRLTGFMISFYFERKGSNWKMTNLEVVNIGVDGDFVSLEMGSKTAEGDKVECPIGLSFACSDGVFKSNSSASVISGSLKFPNWRMQVFEVRRGKFGPMWECGELMSIGLWVGLIVSLGFALICAWGFTMLASIETMDRFDDPKGKTIHIPQSSD